MRPRRPRSTSPGHESNVVPELLERIARMNRLVVEGWTASPGDGAPVVICGEGVVRVERIGRDAVVLRESGGWRGATRPLRFHNRWVWSREGGMIRIARFRGGRPEALVDLVATSGGFVTREPHDCGQDRYTASLSLNGDAITVEWRISGPRKRQRLCTTYHTTVERWPRT